MNYIDAEKLKIRIAQIQKEHPVHPYSENYESGCDEGYLGCCDELLSFINSLQQEQPEVDLEKEIEEHAIYMPHGEFASDNERLEDMEWARKEFRHFYDLGLNARKEE